MKKLIITIILLSFSVPAWSAVLYVRTDGGNGTQCDGLTDHALAGASGTNCSLNHPNWTFPPIGSDVTGSSQTRKASSGDTVVVGQGQYRMGRPNDSGTDTNINMTCGGDTASCIGGEIPNGVTVIGCAIGGCGCVNSKDGVVTCTSTRPELWGAGNTMGILNASNSTGVTIKDIEITDHESRGYNYLGPNSSTMACGSTTAQPTMLSGHIGLRAQNAVNLTVTNVNIHGLCAKALYAPNMTSPTFTGVNFNYNGEIGIDNDSTGSCSTCGWTGTITFSNSSIIGTGCIENWQSDGQIISGGCFTTFQGGYGDGIGMASTAGNWVFNDVDISHNMSDGLDLLYLNKPPYSGGFLTVRRSRFEGNNGNQIKFPSDALIEDNMIIGNCMYFKGASILSSYVEPGETVPFCRAQGAPVAIEFRSTAQLNFISNTVTGIGNVVFETSGACAGQASPLFRNNIIVGGRDAQQDTSIGYSGGANDYTDIYYNSGSDGNGLGCSVVPTFTNNYCVGMFKDTNECGATNTVISVANQNTMNFTGSILQGGTTANGSPGTGISSYATYSNEPTDYAANFYLQITSPAIDGANQSYGDGVDFNNFSRTLPWDVGAVEYGSIPSSGGGGGSSSASVRGQITGRGSISGGMSLP